MYILGIFNDHNATACLLKDGKIVGIVSEERFTRIKNFRGFPRQAITYLLKENSITAKDIDFVTTNYLLGSLFYIELLLGRKEDTFKTHPFTKVLFKITFGLQKVFSFVSERESLRPLYKVAYFFANKFFNKRSLVDEIEFMSSDLGIAKEKFIPQSHHVSHAAASYYCSPFNQEKCLVFVGDGGGEGISSTVDIFENDSHTNLATNEAIHSLGMIFFYVTEYLGMKALEHEYKVMGLAPYAKEEHGDKTYEKIKHWVTLDETNPLKFKGAFDTHYARRYIEKAMYHERFDNIAYAFQKLLEERVVEWVRAGIKQTGIKTICLSGGLFMNVKLNMKVAQLPEVERLYIVPSCGDESGPMGACFLTYMDVLRKQGKPAHAIPLDTIYFGPHFTNQDIEAELRTRNFHYEYVENIEERCAEIIAAGDVIARLHGKMEFGARALGNRSILTHPAKPELTKIINDQVKKRDFWMPFAPSILKERSADYIINPKNIDSPYMMMAFPTTPLAQSHLAAAMHPYDFTVRPQLLEESHNPSYYKLIRHFEKLTGIGAVLNTSFNLHGLPIVMSPAHALNDFENSNLHYLALENYLITKK